MTRHAVYAARRRHAATSGTEIKRAQKFTQQGNARPRPPLLAGDTLEPFNGHERMWVSIRARHCWRAIPRSSSSVRSSTPFQSAPAIAGGRYIRIRCRTDIDAGFNPRPPLLAGDTSSRAAMFLGLMRFNPRPPLLAGDTARPVRRGGRLLGFNPRPPLLAGDTLPGCASDPATPKVSIRARHCWRAIPLPWRLWTRLASFQSAPAIAGGRYPLMAVAVASRLRAFQSAPAIAGGRYRRVV